VRTNLNWNYIMAKPKNEIENLKTTSTEIAAPLSFETDAGAGMEGATADSFAIPFLSVLQKGSPQVDEASGSSIEGAKAGMLFENVTGRMFDGKAGIDIIPCAYRRVFLRWGPKSGEGSGFKGELSVDEIAVLRGNGQIVEQEGRLYFPLADGSVSDKKCDRVADVRNHYVLLVDRETGGWTNALLSLGSTQIKKSKMLMSALASVKVQGSSGMYTPPTFANVVSLSTVPESNDKGTWHGVRFELAGAVSRSELYLAAKAFHASVASGTVEAKYSDADTVNERSDKF
jgi:hypothetical protein